MEIKVEDFEKEFEKSLKRIKAFSKITNNSNEVFMKIKSELFVLKTRLAKEMPMKIHTLLLITLFNVVFAPGPFGLDFETIIQSLKF